MRFSVEGCVENRLSRPRPDSRLMMNKGAVAGFCSAEPFSIFNLMSASIDFGQCGSKRLGASANTATQIVSRIFARAADRHLNHHGGERRQERNQHRRNRPGPSWLSRWRKNIPNCASMEIAPAMVAVIVMMSVSRFLIWVSSWATTPAPSSGESMSSNPVVDATAACCGLRPVAKAFGCGLSMR